MESEDEIEQFSVEPYLYEPPARNISEDSSNSDDDSDTDISDDEIIDERVGNNEWCTCHACEPLPTSEESVCCREFTDLEVKLEEEGLRCIANHTGFIGNCLNKDVIEVSFFEFLQVNGPIGDEEPIHEVYRHIAYRRLARWIWQRLRKKERRPLPACAVNAIRKRFPSLKYTGFRYVGHDLK